MELNERMLEVLLSLPITARWPGLPEILQRLAGQTERHWQVPVLTCMAVGGSPEQAVSAMAAIACLHSSILLIDDLLDADPRGEYHRIGAPATANLALSLQALGLEVLAQSELPAVSTLVALQSFNLAALTIAGGQQWDTQNPMDETAYWQIVEMKSAPFFGTAMQLGALMGGAQIETAERLRQLGSLYGTMIQIHDDLNDTMATPANPDWVLGRSPLPILFAQTVEYPERGRFLDLRQELQARPTLEVLEEAQTILLKSGAISYSLNELCRRHQHSKDLLNSLALSNCQGLELLIEDLIAPVNRLFAAIAEQS